MIHALIAALLFGVVTPDPGKLMTSMHIPGVQMAVIDHGKVTASAFGVKNLANKAPVDVHTRFEIGSITKQFTAAAILQLKSRGKLALDDPLGKYIPQYARGRKITLRQMLLQISGIPNYTSEKGFGALIQQRHGAYVVTKAGNMSSVIALIAGKNLDFTPGTKWEYSNSNYYLLGHVVEVASGMPWSAYIAKNIFKPAGMNESSFMEDEAGVADMATGYTMTKHGISPAGSFNGWAGGAGTIVSTASDLAKWDIALFGGRIISAADLALMTSPGKLEALDNAHYGFGWVIDTFDGQKRIWHNGGTLGFSTSNEYYPQSSQTIIVFANNSDANADEIADTAFDQLHPDLAAAKAKPAAGEDAVVTARIKDVWAQLKSGHPDRTQFTDEANKAFTPEVIAGANAQFAPLGDPTAWVYRGQKSASGITTYQYRVTFSSGTVLNIYMGLTADGKVASYYLTPN